MIAVAILGFAALLAIVAGRWTRWPVWLLAPILGLVPAVLMGLFVLAMGGRERDVVANGLPVFFVATTICLAAAAIGRWRRSRLL